MPEISWIKPDVPVIVPSGLGGVYRARVISVSETHAILQNEGNANGFDTAAPYRRPLGQLRQAIIKEAI